VGDAAEGAEGDRVADPIVADRRTVAGGFEGVGVLPERVGAAGLGVDEAVRWFPGLDAGLPADRHAMEAEPVVEQGAGLECDWLRGEDLEVEPRWGQGLEIPGVAVEGKGVLDWEVESLLSLQ
jgi:hypothetical protein